MADIPACGGERVTPVVDDAVSRAPSTAVTGFLELDVQWRRGDFSLQAKAAGAVGAIGLVGPSGSGKSTLLSLIAGLQKPDVGRIVLDGEILCDTSVGIFLPPEQRRIGIVYQDARLFPHLSVHSNLLYGFNRRAPQDRRFDIDAIVDLLAIGHLLKRRPRDLSGGEKQRVALGRALLYSPRMLLLDEPLASLDNVRKQQVLPFLRNVRDQLKIPMLYVSHVPGEVDYLAESIWTLEAGRLLTVPVAS